MSPLYPGLLSLVFRLFGVYSLTSAFVILTINSLLSTLTCIPVYFSAKYALGLRGAKISAWAWALYPFAIYFSAGRVWEYALTSLLFTTCFCIAQRIHQSAAAVAWIGFGALYGITAHSNASIMSTLPFLLGFALWQAHKAGKPWVLNGALTMLTFFAVLTPWTLRNYRALGVIVPIRDNIWLELYADDFGNAPNDHTSPPTCRRPALSSRQPCRDAEVSTMGEIPYLAQKKRHVSRRSQESSSLRVSGRQDAAPHRLLLDRLIGVFPPRNCMTSRYTPETVFYVSTVTLFMLLGIRSLWRTNRTAVHAIFVDHSSFSPSPTTSRIP